ncbi:kinase-like domain-containing protein [Chytriomyces sp. MP71]|nr:kinase-like domain-containing protein [Chytriomyces sp. MP71]
MNSTLDADLTNVAWLQSLGLQAATASLSSLSDTGGLSATIQRLTVSDAQGSVRAFIVKTTANLARSQSLGLAREALFYNSLATSSPDFVPFLPQIVYANGDMSSGEKTIIMEDASESVQSGHFFGAASPHNWSKDLPALTAIADESIRKQKTLEIARLAFEIAGTLHASFWMDRTVFEAHSWLRGADWFFRGGEAARASWTAAQEWARGTWMQTRAKIAKGESKVHWDPFFIACMDASFEKTSWDAYRAVVASPDHTFTLVHGDYHPANMMWNDKQKRLILLDWEVVGVGSGPQDCAQYLISHMYPDERREAEEELLRAYYSKLDSSKYSYEKCKAEYVAGGTSRWVWLNGLMSGMIPDDWMQYFHDQLLAFIKDHGVTPDTIEMPRI